ncbi:MAG: hypothetical protein M3R02_09780 [Chloroflexota bacterium]|nr:hypothetical protein [Chloroflexota bacterium]
MDRRLDTLERHWPKPVALSLDAGALQRAAERLAAEHGVPLDEVVREVEADMQRAADAGVATLEEMVAFVAAREGLDPAMVLAEAERVITECRGAEA